MITQVSTEFPHSKVTYSNLLPRAYIPIYTINYINHQLTASCSKPHVLLVGHENRFAYGPDVLHDDRHTKKRHIGLFATNLINAVRGKIKPKLALRPGNTFTPSQRPPMGKYTSYSNAMQNNITKLDYFLSKHHQPNIKRSAHHFFVKKGSKEDTMTLFQMS